MNQQRRGRPPQRGGGGRGGRGGRGGGGGRGRGGPGNRGRERGRQNAGRNQDFYNGRDHQDRERNEDGGNNNRPNRVHRGGGNSRQAQTENRAERRIPPLGYKTLEEIAGLNPNEALHKLASYKKGFEALLRESEIRFDLMIQLTTALAKACFCRTSSETLYDLVATLQAENFITTHLAKHIRDWPHMISLKNSYKDIIPNLLALDLSILSSLLSKLPSSFNDVGIILLCLDSSIDKCLNEGVVFSEEILTKIDEFKDFHTAIENQEYERQRNGRREYLSKEDQDGPPPEDDFREYPIFPMTEELKDAYRPSLRRNIVNRGYDNVDHYLDIQFRLLREDFVSPLRQGISEYRSYLQTKEGKQQMRLQDVYVYYDVQVLEAKPFDDGILHVTRFNVDHLKRVKWERSKRLIYGSLVCLSSDDFETVMFAVVANRKAEMLKEGLIELKFDQIDDFLPTLFSRTFTMVESSAYFEAYRHVLKRLQDTNENNFPLERYIVNAEPRIELPSYLRRSPFASYDLSPVARSQRVINVLVTRSRSWPPLFDFDLDSSQYDAFKAALTEELCLIQGPPGTGKTYIGLKIVETLLRNRQVWSPDNDQSPILLICFTNHALDQFLEGILSFLPEGIVRIGGRSSSEKLKEFNLNELRRNRSKSKQRPKHQYIQVKQIRDKMIQLVKEMQATQKATKAANSKILKEKKLMDVMTRAQYVSLLTGFHTEETPNLKTGEYIAYWLGAVVGGPEVEEQLGDDDVDEPMHPDVAPPLVIKPNNRSGVRRRRGRQNILEGQPLKEYITKNLAVIEEIIQDEIIEANNVWGLNLVDRWRLYRHWVVNHRENLQRLLRAANRSILEDNILRPYIKLEQWKSLTENRNPVLRVQRGQFISLFLGVLDGDPDDLTQRSGLIANFNDIADENGAIVMMREYMRTHEEVCRLNVARAMLVYVAKGLAQFGPMNKFEAQRIDNVYELPYQNRWRLYKYWVSLYCRQLQQRLNVSQTNLLREGTLRPQMTDAQNTSLNDQSQDENIGNVDRGQLISLWLGAYSGVPITTVQEVIEALPQEDGDIDILGEAELMNEERYIEGGNDDEINEALENLEEYDEDDEDDGVDIVGGPVPGTEEGWMIAGRDRRSIRKYVNKNLRKVDRMPEERAIRVTNLWELQMPRRWDLYRYWVHLFKQKLQGALLPLQEEYERQIRLLKEVREEENVDIIKNATIIALTTTGAAKHHHLIQRVHPKVVIVEEAAEVLEAHIVTSLTEKCQHLILIGDHQQLRPSPTVYELSTRYHLDVSLFERLINNKFPRHRLNLQHRMRPEISQLLKLHEKFYPDLEDDESVLYFDNIQGIEKNVYFLDHTYTESSQNDDRSRSNEFEAEFLTSLCRYFLQQGYRPEQITILTAYTGQLWNFKALMPKSIFGNVRVCPVDRFQGEENDIILLSLVRSNERGSIGFLSIANRVCVALSRAKKGLYCVGNFSLLSGQNDLWKVITTTLRSKGLLGKSMKLKCHNHPEVVTEVRVAQDFKAVPEGGCKKPCETRLDCGHVCPLICHPRNTEHIDIKCTKKCTRPICELNHRCTRFCYQECLSKCNQLIRKQLDCGHNQEIKCHEQNSTEIHCREPCDKVLECGHRCKNKCGEGCTSYCRVKVRKKFQCGHEVPTDCGNNEEKCPEPCNSILKCDHPCQGTCGGCKKGRLHVACNMPCGKTLICGHSCTSVCSTYCPPCEKKCENRCIHSKCIKKCGQLCTPCQEPCEWTCAHKTCAQPCGQPCTRNPCDEPCQKTIIKCGHHCIGICGEKCPNKCRICQVDEVTEILFGNEDDEDARICTT
ncbi:NFX1-type zinc finger-containing protein 1 [Holothuria leucospilota]|uniref:NFX1-type zinc finger-containing protein 1 n=1 Tax=Holothuria leucospilota TaxID=206669 RepID=A0A9Q1HEF1_HOLLE|nr:NFX1-type zinc finger-containing protein 1 [Holothuria leucospilota]